MEDSIFTKIIKGEIPSYKLYEDDETFVFLDIHPVATGHTLVIPKKQVEFLWDLDEATYQAVMSTAKKVALHIRDALGVPYVGVQVVGTEVPHAHVHLIPFYESSEFYAHRHMSTEPDHGELAKIAVKLAL